jgi:hypothetical protein
VSRLLAELEADARHGQSGLQAYAANWLAERRP